MMKSSEILYLILQNLTVILTGTGGSSNNLMHLTDEINLFEIVMSM